MRIKRRQVGLDKMDTPRATTSAGRRPQLEFYRRLLFPETSHAQCRDIGTSIFYLYMKRHGVDRCVALAQKALSENNYTLYACLVVYCVTQCSPRVREWLNAYSDPLLTEISQTCTSFFEKNPLRMYGTLHKRLRDVWASYYV